MKAWLGCLFATGLTAVPALDCFAQNAQASARRATPVLSGLGVVGEEIFGVAPCGPNAAGAYDAALLESPVGAVVARLEWRRCVLLLIRDDISERLYRSADLVEISYEAAALVYHEQRGEFARVLAQEAPPGLWVRISDLPGGRLLSWPEIMVDHRRNYRSYEGLPLHELPSEDSAVLATLRERSVHESMVHQLLPTGELSGQWGEFKVVEWNSDFYIMGRAPDAAPTGREWRGWLRLTNAAGLPEFWFYTRD